MLTGLVLALLLLSMPVSVRASEAACDKELLKEALDRMLDAVEAGDYTRWIETMSPAHRVDGAELLFQMLLDDDFSSSEYRGRFAREIEAQPSSWEGRDACRLYRVEGFVRDDSAAVFVHDTERWTVAEFWWPPDFLLKGEVVDGLSVNIRTRGNQRLFRDVGSVELWISFEADPGKDVRFPLSASELKAEDLEFSLRARAVEPESGPSGFVREREAGSSSSYFHLAASDFLGNQLAAGVYELTATYETSRKGWQSEGLTSNSLIIELHAQ